MDPNETLRLIRQEQSMMLYAEEQGDSVTYGMAARELAEHVTNLDEWLTKGGFLPDAWRLTESGRKRWTGANQPPCTD